MKRLRILASVALGLALTMLLITPAAGQSDTTPPRLVSLSLSPNQVDVSMSDQSVAVTAVVTDDLSGVAMASVALGLNVEGGANVGTALTNAGGDTFTGTLNIPQFAANGIWKVTLFSARDNANNQRSLTDLTLFKQGFRVALGVGSFDSSYSRRIHLTIGSNSRNVQGQLKSGEFACYRNVPVVAERKTQNGWKLVSKEFTTPSATDRFDGTFYLQGQEARKISGNCGQSDDRRASPDDVLEGQSVHNPQVDRRRRRTASTSPLNSMFPELVIDCEEDRTLRAVLVGMLREADSLS